MPQVSRRPLNKNIQEKIQDLFTQSFAICSKNKVVNEFLDDLLTPTEKTMLSKRLAIAYLLEKKYPYDTIKSILKVSTPTIASISLILKQKGGGIRKILHVLYRRKQLKSIFESLAEVAIELIGKGKGGDWKSTESFLYQRKMEKQSPL